MAGLPTSTSSPRDSVDDRQSGPHPGGAVEQFPGPNRLPGPIRQMHAPEPSPVRGIQADDGPLPGNIDAFPVRGDRRRRPRGLPNHLPAGGIHRGEPPPCTPHVEPPTPGIAADGIKILPSGPENPPGPDIDSPRPFPLGTQQNPPPSGQQPMPPGSIQLPQPSPGPQPMSHRGRLVIRPRIHHDNPSVHHHVLRRRPQSHFPDRRPVGGPIYVQVAALPLTGVGERNQKPFGQSHPGNPTPAQPHMPPASPRSRVIGTHPTGITGEDAPVPHKRFPPHLTPGIPVRGNLPPPHNPPNRGSVEAAFAGVEEGKPSPIPRLPPLRARYRCRSAESRDQNSGQEGVHARSTSEHQDET
ncbi:hypothetical protein J3R03_009060 [Actinoplanes couchii]|nr:hypothetical protein [Actinoplanes couchii]